MALAQLGMWLGLYAPLKILLPLLADSRLTAPGLPAKETVLAVATLVGSLVALLANPVAGLLSDRTRGRWGRRHPWILAGSVVAALSIALLPRAGSPVALVLGWGLAKLGLNASLAGLNGSVADRVPGSAQGTLWGWISLAQPLGLVLGVLVCSSLVFSLPLAAGVLSLLLLATAVPLLLAAPLPGDVVLAPPLRIRQPLAALRHPVFARLWWARFWLYLGWSASTVYLLYFLEDRLGLSRPQALAAQTLLLVLYTVGTVLSAAWAGRASDRRGRRLPFVLAGSTAMALACALMLISQTLVLALLGSTLLGLGYGVYVSTHQALVVEHLPDPLHHARDLGLFNGANTAPMVLAPALAWILVTRLGGYTSLFAVSCFLILVSNLPLLRLTWSRLS